MRRLIPLGVLVLIAACRDESVPCGTAQCRQDAVLAAWAADPSKGAEAIAALPDAVERSAAVARIMEADPSRVSELCAALPEGKLRVRCQRTSDRPHLWHPKTKPVVKGMRKAGGPRSHRLAPERPRTSGLLEVPADLGICVSAPDPHTCAWARAMELAAKGEVRQAAARCAGIEVEEGEADLWQAECRFSAAEESISVLGAKGYPGGVDLCLSAGSFQERCLIHLARDLASRTPPADGTPGPALESTVAAAGVIAQTWSQDPAGPKFVDHFWSMALGYAFQRAEAVTGDMLDGLPERVQPHVHSAAAWRLMKLQPAPERSLQEWAQALDKALRARSGRPERPLAAVHMTGLGNLWHAGVDEDHPVQAVIYMGMGRRAASEVVAEDRLIAILEAAARQEPALTQVIQAATEHPSLAVRWTALRLKRTGPPPYGIKRRPGG